MNINNPALISEREFEVINVIASGIFSSQRQLSFETGMSLGMTNLVLKRLVTKGLLKIRQLDRRKVEYMLTSKGFSEKAKKSYRYVWKTINSIVLIRENIKKLIQAELSQGTREFVLVGNGNFHDVVELAVKDIGPAGFSLRRAGSVSGKKLRSNAVVLHAGEVQAEQTNVKAINLVKALSDLNFVEFKQPEPLTSK